MESDLRGALYAAIASFADTRSLRVAYPNVAFNPGDDPIHLRVDTLPVPPDVQGITNGWSIYVWLLQVGVHVRDGVGEIRALDEVDAIREAFPFRHAFVVGDYRFEIVAPATVAPPVALDGWLLIPTTLRIQALA